jgi:uncharacterized protein YyaL (SSP411 family)
MGAEGQDGPKEGRPRPANRLAGEKSPYLLQHAYNPVDWYPWGEEAFEKARRENKPILLSIGYSTCHWCHVMERESFEDEKIAAFLNRHYVSIKLDREERPDVDRVYMTAYQAMSRDGGGWPLNMILTPELKPFFGGTYFPPAARRGRVGFMDVLEQIQKQWEERGEEIKKGADDSHRKLADYFSGAGQPTGGKDDLAAETVSAAARTISAIGDRQNGGWGSGPKFPQPSHLRFLLRSGDEEARSFALMTCRKMAGGGIYDHLGGGFHRYAVDGVWLVPHFEKMLYDQAQLIDVYLDAWQLTGDEGFRQVAMETLDYVLRDLSMDGGGFLSAQDAQSEGKEGKYYCWTEKELRQLLEEPEWNAVRRHFGVTETGNFLDHSDPEPLRDQNILYGAESATAWEQAERDALVRGVALMRDARAERVSPPVDDKVLASWNGLMIAASARAGRVLGEERYLHAAVQAHRFVIGKLWDEERGVLYHRWRDGERDSSQQAESYLYMIRGSRLLYETTLEGGYLELAVALADGARERFFDEKNGGFFDGEAREDVFLRWKDDFDSALPTVSSVGAMEFSVLAEMTGREDLREVATKTLGGRIAAMKESPSSVSESLRALDFHVSKPSRLVIAGGQRREEFLAAAWSGYRRHLVVMGTQGPVDEFTAGLKPAAGKTTAFLCVGQSCRPPETDPEKLGAWLAETR